MKHLTTDNIAYHQDLSILSFVKTRISEHIVFVERQNQDISVNGKLLKANKSRVDQLIRGSSNNVYWYFFFEKLTNETMLYVPEMYNTSQTGYVCSGSAKSVESLSSVNLLKTEYFNLLFKPNFKGAKSKKYEAFISAYINGDVEEIKKNCYPWRTFGELIQIVHDKNQGL